jgi:uracil-DNA glycosylase family 4
MDSSIYESAMSSNNYLEFTKHFRTGCIRCSLSEHNGNYPVLYRGNPNSKIMLIGEAPGKVERELGKPFTGPAGQLLDRMMSAIDINTNEDLLITNVTYCRPVAQKESGRQNYTPRDKQIERCWPFTKKSIDLIRPKIIIACGLSAAKTILSNKTLRMGDVEGLWIDRNVFIMRHPASILHLDRDPRAQKEIKNKVWEYLKFFRDTYQIRLQEAK